MERSRRGQGRRLSPRQEEEAAPAHHEGVGGVSLVPACGGQRRDEVSKACSSWVARTESRFGEESQTAPWFHEDRGARRYARTWTIQLKSDREVCGLAIVPGMPDKIMPGCRTSVVASRPGAAERTPRWYPVRIVRRARRYPSARSQIASACRRWQGRRIWRLAPPVCPRSLGRARRQGRATRYVPRPGQRRERGKDNQPSGHTRSPSHRAPRPQEPRRQAPGRARAGPARRPWRREA